MPKIVVSAETEFWTLEVVNQDKRTTQGDFRSMLRTVVGM